MADGRNVELEPLVMIPGMVSDARVFAPQLEVFSRFMPIMVAPPVGGDTVEDIAAQLLPQLPNRFALLGQGLGGVVAMEILRRSPAQITRLCLISASAQADSPVQSSEREPHIIGARTGHLPEAIRSVVAPDLLAPSSHRIALAESLIDMGLDLGAEVFVAQSRAMQRRGDLQGGLRRCAGPALVLRGEHDRMVPVKRLEALATLLPRGTLMDLPRAAHIPSLENPQGLNQALAEWMSQPL